MDKVYTFRLKTKHSEVYCRTSRKAAKWLATAIASTLPMDELISVRRGIQTVCRIYGDRLTPRTGTLCKYRLSWKEGDATFTGTRQEATIFADTIEFALGEKVFLESV